ncbi:hypothetical protein [Bradyrhizobium sp. AZCC 1721]|uniref:hypothetical protein n=1 Tax=Bradyrhizobium sp. AZCC 1721 TaxID=3117016 RepID=UPI002FF3B220
MVQDFKRRVTSYRAFAIAAALGFSSNAIAESIQLNMHVALQGHIWSATAGWFWRESWNSPSRATGLRGIWFPSADTTPTDPDHGRIE